MKKVAIVDIACGFRSESITCMVSDERDLAAADRAFMLLQSGYAADDILIITTGNVPYSPRGKTLAQLKQENVMSLERDVPVILAVEGVGTFSEARYVCSICKKQGFQKLVIVSSNWYFWSGQWIWKLRAAEQGLEIEFVKLYQSAGLKTKLTYLAYAAIVITAIAWRFEGFVERKITALQEKRKQGFTSTGCG